MIQRNKIKLNNTDFILEVRRAFRKKCGLINGKSMLFIDDSEIPLLAALAEQTRIGIVEIGCLYGGSAAMILLNKPFSLPFTSIDPFISDSMEERARSSKKNSLCHNKKIRAQSGKIRV
ncbi:MAG: hypothetical protein ABIA63_06000 [bacterium]